MRAARRCGGDQARRLLGALALSTQPLDLKAVEARPEIVLPTDLALALVKVGVVELDDSSTASADHVVVPFSGRDSLIHVVLPAQTGLAGEATLDEQIQRAVDRRSGDPLALVTELEKERIRVEVAIGVEKLLEQHEALFGNLLVVVAQELDEKLLSTLHFDLLTAVAT
jgi:hypothetical protein